MKKLWMPVILLATLLFGCGAGQNGSLDMGEAGGKANDFNPYMREKLPNTRHISLDGSKMLGQIGGSAQSIEGEARHRKNWREEIYPVVFGNRKAPHEIIVVLNFSEPECERLWQAVTEAAKSLKPADCKIVIYGKSDETYGIDLTGMAIWLAHSRKGQAMPWITYALSRWNAAKDAQKSAGKVKKFSNEYDAVPTPQDFPILQGYLSRVNPPVPASQELALARYCYDAGNVNMYQATQICKYYGATSLPAVIVDGKVLKNATKDAILAALN